MARHDAEWLCNDTTLSYSGRFSMDEFSVTKNNQKIAMVSYTAGLGPAAISRTKNKIRPLLIELFRK